jgi:hypothetical protein
MTKGAPCAGESVSVCLSGVGALCAGEYVCLSICLSGVRECLVVGRGAYVLGAELCGGRAFGGAACCCRWSWMGKACEAGEAP